MDLLVIGVIDIHSIIRTSLKKGTINPVSEYTERFSGSALQVAINAAQLNADVGIISPVGRDAVGLMDLLKRYQVDYSRVVLSSKKNPNFLELYTSNRHYTLYYQGARADFNFKKIDQNYLKKAKAVHMCFPDQKVTDYLVDVAGKEKVLTSVDASFSDTPADIVFTEGKRKEKGKRKRKRKGAHTIVMDFEKEILCNGMKIPVFRDSTYYKNGVKDAFIAAFLIRYVKSEHIEHAALYGSCAAYLCSQNDKRVLTCTKGELDTFFEGRMKEE
ncbi:MAG: hypothetical protein HXS46_16125 [Theionarchaea archaeon]|nr:MAG: hypothetical protein AYK18_03010 [Theionarchaea archaeon DG-70]MBU7012214.1 hypothetical protein [Theionarchaea archaeon]